MCLSCSTLILSEEMAAEMCMEMILRIVPGAFHVDLQDGWVGGHGAPNDTMPKSELPYTISNGLIHECYNEII